MRGDEDDRFKKKWMGKFYFTSYNATASDPGGKRVLIISRVLRYIVYRSGRRIPNRNLAQSRGNNDGERWRS